MPLCRQSESALSVRRRLQPGTKHAANFKPPGEIEKFKANKDLTDIWRDLLPTYIYSLREEISQNRNLLSIRFFLNQFRHPYRYT